MAAPPLDLPSELTAGQARLVSGLVADWQLSVDGPPTHGASALILLVLTAAGRPAVLKLGGPGDEPDHEHLALQHWHGSGAVELLRADPRRRALLLERLHAADVGRLADAEACEVVAGLYRRLHIRSVPQLRTLTALTSRWTEVLRGLPTGAPVPRRLIEQAAGLGQAFVEDPGTTGTMIHSDLHYANVLAGDREAWLAIDPSPLSGDPHYEVAPLLWHRWEGISSSGNVREAIRRRFFAVVEAAGLDEDRARDWVIVRALHLAAQRIIGPQGRDEIRDWVTRCISVAKAVQG